MLLDVPPIELSINNRNINCAVETILCFQDSDCNQICANTSFNCKHGECKKKKQHGCNETNGLIPLDDDGTNCLSMFPQLWNMNGTKADGVCTSGNLTTNVFLHYPKVSDCHCLENFSLYTKRVGKLEIPICLQDQDADIYSDIRGLKKLM